MICSYKKSRKQGRFTLASVELATELPFFVCPFFEFNERVLRQNCHLYANFEGDKEKTRARVVAVADRAKDDGEQKGMTESERGLSPTESTHVVTHLGSSASPGGGTFSEAAYTVRQTGPDRRKASFTSREKRATCGDNSIVHFIRSAALRYKYAHPLSWNSAGDKARRVRGRGKGARWGGRERRW